MTSGIVSPTATMTGNAELERTSVMLPIDKNPVVANPK